jgi:tetratricopeptide (TPR) repeat protein
LGYTVHRLGKIDEAIYCYLRYLDVQPDDADVHANLIAALESQGRYDEAIAAGQRAVERFPSNAALLFMLARNNFFAGKVEAAIVQLKSARDLDPGNSEIYRVLGVALRTQSDFDGALANFQEALKFNPSDADAHLAAADVYQRLGRFEDYLRSAREARRLFESTKNDSSLKFACWEEGWALYKLGRWDESVKASECALKIDDSLTAVRFNLALALLHLGSVDRAKEEYRKAREPGDAESLKNDGIDDLKLALQERPDLPAGKEILQELENVYQDLTSKREEKLMARRASAGGPRSIR